MAKGHRPSFKDDTQYEPGESIRKRVRPPTPAGARWEQQAHAETGTSGLSNMPGD
jgi:hypothetical protein